MSAERGRPLSDATRGIPPDLAALVVVVAVGWVTLLVALPPDSPLAVPVALFFVLVAPGYAIVAALFPARRAAETDDGHRLDVRGLDFPERLALGVGTSIVVAPFVAFGLQSTVVGVSLVPVVLLLGLLTLTATAVAFYRWRALPSELRHEFVVPPLDTVATADRLLAVAIAVAVVVAISSVGYATTAQSGEKLTELYVLTVQDDGSLLADDYPGTLELGETTELYVGLDNHRGVDTTYTVVGVVQEVDLETGAVIRQEEFRRYTTTVADEQSWGVQHEFTPTWIGVNVRVVYLLYLDDAPGTVSRETAAQSVHLWLDVVEPSSPTIPSGDDAPADATAPTDADATSTETGAASNDSATETGAVPANSTTETGTPPEETPATVNETSTAAGTAAS